MFLWADAINDGFRELATGERIVVKLRLFDDHSDPDEVRRIYSNLSADTSPGERPDALIGPFSSELSLAAAEASARSNLLLILPAAASDQLFNAGFRHILGLAGVASWYMAGALQQVYNRGARSVALLAGSGRFPEEMCNGALDQARRLNMSVVENKTFTISVAHTVLSVKKLTQLEPQPDVVATCGYVSEASMLAVSALAFDFSPKALILSQGSNPALINSIGARNANYITGPTAWLPGIGDESCGYPSRCSVFSGGSHFSTVYKAKYHREPTYQSAAAAAAGVLLMEAIDRSAFDKFQFRQVLMQSEVHTLYGSLRFQSNGRRLDSMSTVRTMQLQPLEDTADRFQRFSSTFPKLLCAVGCNKVDAVKYRYPMPTWYEKRMEVYPCVPGQFMDEPASCRPCAAGRYRQKGAFSCQQCEAGTFAPVPGHSQCLECLEGANCSLRGTAVPEADRGHYLLPSDLVAFRGRKLHGRTGPAALKYPACRPADLCLGNNTCSGNSTGLMCHQCLPGTTNQLGLSLLGRSGGPCMQCPDPQENILLMALAMLAFAAYAYVVFRATLASALSVRALQSIILKIVINYAVFTQVVLQATGFWDDAVEELRAIFGIGEHSADSMQAHFSLDCMLKQLGHQQSPQFLLWANALLSLGLLPAVLLCNFLMCVCHNLLIHWRRQAAPFFQGLDDMSWHWKTLVLEEQQSAAEPTSESQGASCISLPTGSLGSSAAGEPQAWQNRMKQCKELRVTIVQTSVVWIFVLYPAVVECLLRGTTCQELDVLRVVGSIDTICFEAEHLDIFALSIMGIVVYGLGIPACLLALLYKNREKLMQQSIRRKYGFLYNGFELRCYHFECVYMFRKLLILIAAVLPQEQMRATVMLCLGTCFLVHHVRLDPFDDREFHVLDHLEVLNLWCIVATIFGKLLFLASEAEGEETLVQRALKSHGFRGAVFAVVVASHLAFWFSALRALVNDLVVRPLRLRSAARMPLNFWQRVLLSLHHAGGLGNMLVFRAEDSSLDISALSEKERRFLTTALQSTLDCYMTASPEARPALVATALHQAVFICRRTRRLQLDWLMTHHDVWVPYLAGLWGKARAPIFRRMRYCYNQILAAVQRGFGCQDTDKGKEEDEESPGPPQVGKTLSLLQMPAARVPSRWNLRRPAEVVRGLYVEELFEALMILWPEIRKGQPELHKAAFLAQGGVAPTAPVWNERQGIGALMRNLGSQRRHQGWWERAVRSWHSDGPEVGPVVSNRSRNSHSSHEEVAEASQQRLKQLLEQEDAETSRMLAQQLSRANGRSFHFAVSLLVERRRTQKLKQDLESALDSVALMKSQGTAIDKAAVRTGQLLPNRADAAERLKEPHSSGISPAQLLVQTSTPARSQSPPPSPLPTLLDELGTRAVPRFQAQGAQPEIRPQADVEAQYQPAPEACHEAPTLLRTQVQIQAVEKTNSQPEAEPELKVQLQPAIEPKPQPESQTRSRWRQKLQMPLQFPLQEERGTVKKHWFGSLRPAKELQPVTASSSPATSRAGLSEGVTLSSMVAGSSGPRHRPKVKVLGGALRQLQEGAADLAETSEMEPSIRM